MTPIEKATHKKPNLSRLLEWGTPVWVKIKNAGDLERRAKKVNFVGYDLRAKGFRLWPGTRRVMVERDVYFNEKDALTPGTTSIEGEWDDDNLVDQSVPSSSSKTPSSADAEGNEQNRGLTDTVEPPIPENFRATPPPPEPNPEPTQVTPPEVPSDPTPPPPPPHARKRQTEVEKLGSPEPNTGRGQHERKRPGFYHNLNTEACD
ncbi:hypothetical protein K438DRAFT_1755410 [Mycena galopus ATCC 62051]|nr:hypothetical protein K438DRAFT_1755410 [Mycena galopus ATCC 62051]